MVLSLSRLLLQLFAAATLALFASPAVAHKDHPKQLEASRAAQTSGKGAQAEALKSATPSVEHQMMEDHAAAMEAATPKSFFERLVSWVGRTHPFAVHFPIALFPVALVALVLARRRGETVELIRALIIVAGTASVIAAILGWFTGGFTLVDIDRVHLWHRWIGTGLAGIGGTVAFWALRNRNSVYSRGMVVALVSITLILLVQGWLGAALVHGTDHMSF